MDSIPVPGIKPTDSETFLAPAFCAFKQGDDDFVKSQNANRERTVCAVGLDVHYELSVATNEGGLETSRLKPFNPRISSAACPYNYTGKFVDESVHRELYDDPVALGEAIEKAQPYDAPLYKIRDPRLTSKMAVIRDFGCKVPYDMVDQESLAKAVLNNYPDKYVAFLNEFVSNLFGDAMKTFLKLQMDGYRRLINDHRAEINRLSWSAFTSVRGREDSTGRYQRDTTLVMDPAIHDELNKLALNGTGMTSNVTAQDVFDLRPCIEQHIETLRFMHDEACRGFATKEVYALLMMYYANEQGRRLTWDRRLVDQQDTPDYSRIRLHVPTTLFHKLDEMKPAGDEDNPDRLSTIFKNLVSTSSKCHEMKTLLYEVGRWSGSEDAANVFLNSAVQAPFMWGWGHPMNLMQNLRQYGAVPGTPASPVQHILAPYLSYTLETRANVEPVPRFPLTLNGADSVYAKILDTYCVQSKTFVKKTWVEQWQKLNASRELVGKAAELKQTSLRTSLLEQGPDIKRGEGNFYRGTDEPTYGALTTLPAPNAVNPNFLNTPALKLRESTPRALPNVGDVVCVEEDGTQVFNREFFVCGQMYDPFVCTGACYDLDDEGHFVMRAERMKLYKVDDFVKNPLSAKLFFLALDLLLEGSAPNVDFNAGELAQLNNPASTQHKQYNVDRNLNATLGTVATPQTFNRFHHLNVNGAPPRDADNPLMLNDNTCGSDALKRYVARAVTYFEQSNDPGVSNKLKLLRTIMDTLSLKEVELPFRMLAKGSFASGEFREGYETGNVGSFLQALMMTCDYVVADAGFRGTKDLRISMYDAPVPNRMTRLSMKIVALRKTIQYSLGPDIAYIICRDPLGLVRPWQKRGSNGEQNFLKLWKDFCDETGEQGTWIENGVALKQHNAQRTRVAGANLNDPVTYLNPTNVGQRGQYAPGAVAGNRYPLMAAGNTIAAAVAPQRDFDSFPDYNTAQIFQHNLTIYKLNNELNHAARDEALLKFMLWTMKRRLTKFLRLASTPTDITSVIEDVQLECARAAYDLPRIALSGDAAPEAVYRDRYEQAAAPTPPHTSVGMMQVLQSIIGGRRRLCQLSKEKPKMDISGELACTLYAAMGLTTDARLFYYPSIREYAKEDSNEIGKADLFVHAAHAMCMGAEFGVDNIPGGPPAAGGTPAAIPANSQLRTKALQDMDLNHIKRFKDEMPVCADLAAAVAAAVAPVGGAPAPVAGGGLPAVVAAVFPQIYASSSNDKDTCAPVKQLIHHVIETAKSTFRKTTGLHAVLLEFYDDDKKHQHSLPFSDPGFRGVGEPTYRAGPLAAAAAQGAYTTAAGAVPAPRDPIKAGVKAAQEAINAVDDITNPAIAPNTQRYATPLAGGAGTITGPVPDYAFERNLLAAMPRIATDRWRVENTDAQIDSKQLSFFPVNGADLHNNPRATTDKFDGVSYNAALAVGHKETRAQLFAMLDAAALLWHHRCFFNPADSHRPEHPDEGTCDDQHPWCLTLIESFLSARMAYRRDHETDKSKLWERDVRSFPEQAFPASKFIGAMCDDTFKKLFPLVPPTGKLREKLQKVRALGIMWGNLGSYGPVSGGVATPRKGAWMPLSEAHRVRLLKAAGLFDDKHQMPMNPWLPRGNQGLGRVYNQSYHCVYNVDGLPPQQYREWIRDHCRYQPPKVSTDFTLYPFSQYGGTPVEGDFLFHKIEAPATDDEYVAHRHAQLMHNRFGFTSYFRLGQQYADQGMLQDMYNFEFRAHLQLNKEQREIAAKIAQEPVEAVYASSFMAYARNHAIMALASCNHGTDRASETRVARNLYRLFVDSYNTCGGVKGDSDYVPVVMGFLPNGGRLGRDDRPITLYAGSLPCINAKLEKFCYSSANRAEKICQNFKQAYLNDAALLFLRMVRADQRRARHRRNYRRVMAKRGATYSARRFYEDLVDVQDAYIEFLQTTLISMALESDADLRDMPLQLMEPKNMEVQSFQEDTDVVGNDFLGPRTADVVRELDIAGDAISKTQLAILSLLPPNHRILGTLQLENKQEVVDLEHVKKMIQRSTIEGNKKVWGDYLHKVIQAALAKEYLETDGPIDFRLDMSDFKDPLAESEKVPKRLTSFANERQSTISQNQRYYNQRRNSSLADPDSIKSRNNEQFKVAVQAVEERVERDYARAGGRKSRLECLMTLNVPHDFKTLLKSKYESQLGY